MARSLNKVMLIGNLTRDVELRNTPSGAAVASFSIATNRSWKTDSGEQKDEVDFHRIVAWNKLAELVEKNCHKGDLVYCEGRLTTRKWTNQEGVEKTTVEVIVDDVIFLSKRGGESHGKPNESGEIS